jgi:hypothetical protein
VSPTQGGLNDSQSCCGRKKTLLNWLGPQLLLAAVQDMTELSSTGPRPVLNNLIDVVWKIQTRKGFCTLGVVMILLNECGNVRAVEFYARDKGLALARGEPIKASFRYICKSQMTHINRRVRSLSWLIKIFASMHLESKLHVQNSCKI